MANIFEKRDTIKPYEYPKLIQFAKAIQSSFWIPEHFTYDRDVLDYKIDLNDVEKDILKKSMLAIGVVENKVKTFWARIDMRMPKTEIASVGHTFAGNEVIHQMTYEKLLGLLGLEDEFSRIQEVPCMRGRSEYLTKYLQGVHSKSNKEFTKSLILFTLLVENASLFSQFLIVSSFKKYKNILSNFNTVIGATAREENLHAKFGEELINIIRNENPEWFDDEMENKIRRNVQKAFKAEVEVLNWIFEKGELDFLPKVGIEEYLKYRFNKSLRQIGYADEFIIDEELLKYSEYLDVQLTATTSFDFFAEKSTDYAQDSAFDENNLWE